jgi:hypothetical protein
MPPDIGRCEAILNLTQHSRLARDQSPSQRAMMFRCISEVPE